MMRASPNANNYNKAMLILHFAAAEQPHIT
jgi:hypothetical protein